MALGIEQDIYYLVAVPDWRPDEATPLAGFSVELCRSAFLIRAAAMLPADVFELVPEFHSQRSARRLVGLDPVQWHPQSPRALTSEPMPLEMPFAVVLLGPEQDPKDYEAWAASCPTPPTIVAEQGGDLSYADLTVEGLQARFLDICDRLPAEFDRELAGQFRDAISRWSPIPTRKLDYVVGGHNTVIPNVMALVASGYESPVDGPFRDIAHGVQPYVDQIVTTARSVLAERDGVPKSALDASLTRRPALNLFCPAIYANSGSLRLKPEASAQEARRFRIVLNMLERQNGYNFEAQTEAQMRAALGIGPGDAGGGAQPDPHFLMALRPLELSLATEAVGALAASEISAVVRMPNEVNRTAGAVRQFAAHYRGNARNPRRSAEAFRAVQTRIAAAVPPDLKTLINEAKGDIRVIADAHLEWLDVDGLPLCIRRNLSRIPTTPGNLFVSQLTAQPLIRLTPEDLQDVLVISALEPHDRIRGMFEVAFEQFGKQWKDAIRPTFVEVASADELVAALNAFKGALVVFDGHGAHAADRPAVLKLKNEDCDVWSLRGRLERPPPIVVLSACDTHAADRNHATTANGFLALGARAVLASVLPLEAANAASFAARLLYRLAAFVPAVINGFGRAYSWTEIVSGMLRMQLLTDFLRALEAKRLIDRVQYVDLGQRGNMLINGGGDGDAFDGIVAMLAEVGLHEQQAKRELRIATARLPAISYLHMGRPDTIIVDTDERFKALEERIARLAPV